MTHFINYTAILISFILVSQSCKEEQKQEMSGNTILIDCNHINIKAYREYGNFHDFNITDSAQVKCFLSMISGVDEKIPNKCEPNGQVYFKNNDKLLLTADFSCSVYLDCNYLEYSLGNKTYTSKIVNQAKPLLQAIQKVASESPWRWSMY
jgi:hypothetical protein